MRKALYVDTNLIAIVDAVMTLTRSRIRANGPFWLPRPRGPLFVVTRLVSHKNFGKGPNTISALVSCDTWDDTTLTLTLTSTGRDTDCLVWGDFLVTYGKMAPHPSLVNKTISKRMQPSFATSTNGLPMRYRIRSAVVR